MNPRCRHCWHYWATACLLTFTYLELRGFRRSCHRTLSRELRHWLRYDECRWSPLVFVLFGAWLARHISRLEQLPSNQE